MRPIGLHLRMETTLVDVVERALRLNVDFFQCFLTLKTAGRIFPLNTSDIKEFVFLRRKYFKEIYLHVSYWVNPSTIEYNPHRLFKRELSLAKKLEFTHVILHPGSAKGTRDVQVGIDALANMLNSLLEQEPSFVFVLENVAQAFPVIGGDLNHFKLLLERLDEPEKIQFCIDTAHAFSYGYDFSSEKKCNEFINLIDKAIGIDKVRLIHVNDNLEGMGSHVDRHTRLGEGQIGIENLKRFAMHQKLQHIPILSEPPVIPENELKIELQKIIDWKKL